MIFQPGQASLFVGFEKTIKPVNHLNTRGLNLLKPPQTSNLDMQTILGWFKMIFFLQ